MDISLTSGIRSSLLAVQNTDSATHRTVQRLSSGKKVNSALDNPTNFFISASLRNAAADIQQLHDAVSEGVNVINAASKGLAGVAALLQTMKSMVDGAAAASDPVRKAALAKSFDEAYAQINSIVKDSSYAGSNLISNSSADPTAVAANDLTIALNASGSADYVVGGRFMGSGYVLREAPGGPPAWTVDDHGAFLTGSASASTAVGNLSSMALIVRLSPHQDSRGDLDGDGILEAGEGTEIDFELTNNTAVPATGISFNNATISNGWHFLFNTNAALGNVPAHGVVRTNVATDLDLNLPAGSNGSQFSISMDVTSDGVTKSLTFGPFVVGSITNGQTFQATASAPAADPPVATQSVRIDSADYGAGTFQVTIPGVGAKTLYAERQGLRLYHSWAYDGFRSEAGVDAARADVDGAIDTVRGYAAEIGANSMILSVRDEFNDTLANTYITGADNLTLADMNEESASALMLQTRRQLAMSGLRLASEAAQAVLKLLE